jgi:SpoIID/LytB domain protein
LACGNFRALKDVSVREVEIGGLTVKLQFNPARIVSSAAKTSKEELAKRRCFLCRENRPAEQIMLRFEGRKGKKYDILVNPYPIFPDHLVIAKSKHTDQSIWHRYIDMLDLSKKYSGYTFFYNGPKCGASAPDHHHFQGAPKGLMPLENDMNASVDNSEILEYITSVQDASLYHYKKFTSGVFFLRAETSKSAAKLFYRLLDCADILEGDIEPRINLFSWWQDGEYRSIVVFRRSHRSHHYFSEGPDHLTMSPGCADMGGVFIVPVPEEYEKMTPELLAELVEEVSVPKSEEAEIIERLTRTQKNINIGIMSAEELTFEILSDGAGVRKAVARDGKIEYDGALYDELYFDAPTLSTMFAEPSFVLHDVTIGVDFHWERKEVQKFAGALKIIVADGKLVAINVVGIEDYLLSVISSEMSATADEEFLKAHAVISRSWVMAQLSSARQARNAEIVKKNSAQDVSESPVVEYVKWYDKDDHDLFDVCADDHCQRYQGLTRAIGNKVRKVIDATWGQVLKSDGKLCDARFSKCCGGRMEKFSVCWEDKDYDYLQPLPDTPGHIEGERAFCDTSDPVILAKVLNNYDQETVDFYRWTETYDRNAISALIKERSGISLGVLNAVKPIERGVSGRIYRLALVGSERTLVIGKELEIRRTLSKTHLKSSAFEVEYLSADGMVVSSDEDWTVLRLLGSGWGHGVGLCQIGAAVMAVEGYDYTQILEHYYPGSDLEKE